MSREKKPIQFSLHALRWFHILPIILSFACLSGLGWLAERGAMLKPTDNISGAIPSEGK
jgi:hypothetical protein